MPSYVDLTTARTTVPDPVALTTTVRTATGDPTAAIAKIGDGLWRGKKVAAWSAADVTAVQTALDTAPALTPQLLAQRAIDAFPIEYKALVLALIDAINTVRGKLVPPLPDVTPAQALAAIRTKAGTL